MKTASRSPGRKPETPAASTSDEIELKFQLPSGKLRDQLRQSAESALPWLSGAALSETQLISRYYDTPTREFWQAGVALRLRNRGTQWLQHLKWRGDTGRALAGGSVRTEMEWVLHEPQPHFEAIKAAIHGQITLSSGWRETLAPVFETDIIRRSGIVTASDGSQIEIAFDLGVLRAGSAERPISEIELELKQGNPAALFELATALAAATGARLSASSKAAEGYRLADGMKPAQMKSRAAPIAARDSGSAVLCAQLRQSLANLMGNHDLVLSHGQPEGVHQMRVALRRLDAVFRPLQAVLDSKEALQLAEELRWLRGTLAPLRNWDVFATETLPSLRQRNAGDDMPMPGAEDAEDLADLLQPAAQRTRDEARQQVHDALHSQRYASLLVAMAAAAETGSLFKDLPLAAKETLDQPFKELAARWLIEQMFALQKRGERLHKLPPKRQHRFRLKVKKLRYVAELLTNIEQNKALKKLARQLAALQECLGLQNDLFTGIALVEGLRASPLLTSNSAAQAAIADRLTIWELQLHADDKLISQSWLKIERAADRWIKTPPARR
jgi:triphosphatase